MKMRNLVLAVILLFITCGVAVADRQLDRTEIVQIFQVLTNQPRKTWIPSGTIEAKHFAYKTSNGYTTESTVIVKYDGDRFYWEIDIDSHTKETEAQGGPGGKSSRDDFDLNWNKRRVFAWDGERYTMYFRPGNHAIVTEGPTDIPVTVNGPLTAGVVPWGYGVYTLESLSATESSAVEVEVNGQEQIRLTVLLDADELAVEMVFVLDPARDYVVLSYSQNNGGMASTVRTYEDYQLVSGKWVPTTITIERYDESKQSPELLSCDCWDLTSICVSSPDSASFRVPYESNSLVEVYSPITDKPLSYRYYNEVDTESLLQERLAIVADDTQTRNCATVAMKYVAEQLGKSVTDSNLAGLINEPNEGTSLYTMKKFAQELGFYCLAVKTNIHTLENLKGCQTILHLPGPNHYVVLEDIDEDYVWVIDLDSNKFFYRTRLDEFELDWSEGSALLISETPLLLTGTFADINDSELHEIIGGFPKYSCTDLIQEYNIRFCSEPVGGLCGGRYRKWYNRYACELDPEGSSCTGTGFVGNVSSPCINDPEDLLVCIITGEWFSQFIRACK